MIEVLTHNCENSRGKIQNSPLYTEGTETPKKKVLQIGRWQNFLRRLVRGGHKICRSPHPPSRILKIYGGIHKVQSQITSRWPEWHISLSHQWVEHTFRGHGRGSNCLGPARGSTGGQVLSMTSCSMNKCICVFTYTHCVYKYLCAWMHEYAGSQY